MNVKRFSARTSRDALNLVRQALGDDAVVLSTRPCPEGVEVMAMASDSVPQISSPATDSASLPPAETTVEQDAAQLSMSTLSFQDYVRERMLRRRRAEQQAQDQARAETAQAEARAAELQSRPVPPASSLLRVRASAGRADPAQPLPPSLHDAVVESTVLPPPHRPKAASC